MTKRLLIIVILIVVSVITTVNANASEDDYSFNGFSFDYVDASEWINEVSLVITIDCDYPKDVPHHFWLLSDKYTHENIYLYGPKSLTYYGDIESGRFIIELEPPLNGQYNFTVYNDSSDSLLYCFNFDMKYEFKLDLESVKWANNVHTFDPFYKSSISENNIYKIDGIQVNFNLTNEGDIPFKIGDPYTEEIPIYLKIQLYKDGITEPIFTSYPKKIKRIENEQGFREKWFFKPGETFECKESIINNSIDLKKYGPGTYSLNGIIQLANTTKVIFEPIRFSAFNELKITEKGFIPGFEIITVLFSIILIFLLYRIKKE